MESMTSYTAHKSQHLQQQKTTDIVLDIFCQPLKNTRILYIKVQNNNTTIEYFPKRTINQK